jgi:hypothetical protein
MELGKIERPKVEEFTGKKKVYCVNHIFSSGRDEELKRLLDRYWQEIDAHLGRLELAGKVSKIFIEGLIPSTEDPLSPLKEVHERFYNLVKKRLEEGGRVVPIEEEDTFSAYVDLRNCLMLVRNREVYRRLWEYYKEVAEKRLGVIRRKIEESLEEGEAALLVMEDTERSLLEFPDDFEVFLVVPPAYDDILKWFRTGKT